MPIYRHCFYQRSYPCRHLQCKNDEDHYRPKELPSLHQEIPKASYFLLLDVYEKRHSNIPAHISPCFRVKEGGHVIIGQCRPLSKTVRFNVLKVIPAGSSGGRKKAFAAM
ncbi:hypothetical protein V6N13_068570 [Hibiscus sabdariffa]